MKKPKPLPPRPQYMGGFSTDGDFFKMEHKEFVEWCGGRIAVALFNGGIKGEMHNIVCFANARGMMRQWELTNGYP
jgi:hypothetical protein